MEEAFATRSDRVRRDRHQKSRGVKLFVRDIVLIFAAALLISFLVKTFLVRSFYIPSESMEDTLVENDRIIVNQLVPAVTPIQRGDIVVFRDPGGWLTAVPDPEQNPLAAAVDGLLSVVGVTAPDSNDHLIKRVIGLPGDTVECCSEFGQLVINGVAIDEPYIKLPAGSETATRDDFSVTVPEGALWVMGDNRYRSADSAYHRGDPSGGFVPYDHVVGRAFVVSWPLERWQWLDSHSLVFRDVDAN